MMYYNIEDHEEGESLLSEMLWLFRMEEDLECPELCFSNGNDCICDNLQILFDEGGENDV